jgi:hypothetical protein
VGDSVHKRSVFSTALTDTRRSGAARVTSSALAVGRAARLALAVCVVSGCGSHILLGVLDGPDAGVTGDAGPRPSDGGTSLDGTLDALDGNADNPCADYAAQFCEVEQTCNLLVFRNSFWGDMPTCKERRKIR